MIKKIKDFFEKLFLEFMGLHFEHFLASYFASYFAMLFNINFEQKAKQYIDELFADLNVKSFDLPLDSEQLLKLIQDAEGLLKRGNGMSKLELVTNQYIANNKEAIDKFVVISVLEKANEVFENNKSDINKMILTEAICL